jgi:hypothetical protein
MKKYVLQKLWLILLFLSPPVTAQPIPNELLDLVAASCEIVDLEFLCSLETLLTQGENLYDTLYNEFLDFTHGLEQGVTHLRFSDLADVLPMEDILTQLEPLDNTLATIGVDVENIGSAIQAYRQQVTDTIESFEDNALTRFTTARSPEGSYGHAFEDVVRQNPEVQAAIITANNTQGGSVQQAEDMKAATEASRALAENLKTSGAVDEAAASVLRDDLVPGVGEKGTAAQLEQNATDAPSSRLVLQAIAEGLADFMRQDATFAVIEHEALQTLAEQGALTNWQLSTLVGQYADTQLQAVAAFQEQLESAFIEGYDEGTMAADELNEALLFGQQLATFDTALYRRVP